MKSRMKNIIAQITKDIYEREEIIAVTLLASLAGENIFLYGPPGVAKSLISRRLSKAFETKNYFEHLMSKFSTPEEIFGPISIVELKKDKYIRKIDGFLPTADFAFLDEIWKSSPAILNTLLTIINEKKFKNGNEIIKVPLKSLISASNEISNKGEGLEALYDRFLVRLQVLPIQNKDNFRAILQNGASSDEIEIKDKITNEELEKFKGEIEKVKISDDSFLIIETIINKIEEHNKKNKEKIYISDRRWQKAAKLMKASAYFNQRNDETNISDNLLLMHCLWSNEKDKKILDKIIKETIKNSSLSISVPINEIKETISKLEEEIKKELYYSDDIFDTVTLKDGKEYFEDKYLEKDRWRGNIEQKFYISKEYFKTDKNFRPVDENGNIIEWIRGNFKRIGSCKIEVNNYCRRYESRCKDDHYDWKTYHTFKPKVLYKKGDKKKDINLRLIQAFKNEIEEIKKTLLNNLNEMESKKNKFLKEIDNPFVTEEKIKWCIDGIENQINEIKLLEKECERIKGLL